MIRNGHVSCWVFNTYLQEINWIPFGWCVMYLLKERINFVFLTTDFVRLCKKKNQLLTCNQAIQLQPFLFVPKVNELLQYKRASPSPTSFLSHLGIEKEHCNLQVILVQKRAMFLFVTWLTSHHLVLQCRAVTRSI